MEHQSYLYRQCLRDKEDRSFAGKLLRIGLLCHQGLIRFLDLCSCATNLSKAQ